MKKFLLLLLALALIISPVFANGQDEEGTDTIVLKLGDTQAEDHPETQSYYFFAERVAELTDGKVDVQVFPNSALGNHRDMLEGIKMETIQMTKCMATDLSAYFPKVQVFGLPYIFDSTEHMLRVVDGEIGNYFNEEIFPAEDFVVLAWFDAGSRSIYNKTRPIYSTEDTKGLLLRVPENNIYMSSMAAFGATGTPMPMGDIYTGLQTGVIDGAENAFAVYDGMKHFEVAKYFSYTQHIMTPDIIVMKKSYLESLPEDIQAAIWQAAGEMEQKERELWKESDRKFFERLKAAGVQFNDVDKTTFQAAAKSVWADYTDIIGQDLIDNVQSYR
ncbi:MAG: TRAP transporter substrate-binding protein [Sphaerochaetaceae bacterium]